MKKRLFILFFALVTANAFATIYSVSLTTGSPTITCFVGDTIRFMDYTNTPTMVSINKTSGPVVITSPMFTTPDGSGKVIDYVITGNETGFQMNHSAAYMVGTIIIQTSTGISSQTHRNVEVRLFPNPVVNELRILSSSEVVVSIINANGQQIIDQKLSNGPNTINVESLSPGVYFVLIDGGKTKFVKE